MALSNIVDNRSNEHDRDCDIVFEIFYDEAGRSPGASPRNPRTGEKIQHNERWSEWFGPSSVYSATMKAQDIPANVVMYLYDPGVVSTQPQLLNILHPRLPDEPMASPYWLSNTRRVEDIRT